MGQSLQNRVIAYIGLGANLDNPVAQIKSARQAIDALENVQEQAFSGLYRSAPMGPENQPDYINAVMAVVTDLPALALLRKLQHIEYRHGRVRNGERWGPRTLDLDLLLYGDQKIDVTDLIVPHRGIAERAFVLYPLQEIAPQLMIPGHGAITELIKRCPREGLSKL